MSINCWLSKTKHDNPFADNLLSSEMIAINQGYRYLRDVENVGGNPVVATDIVFYSFKAAV